MVDRTFKNIEDMRLASNWREWKQGLGHGLRHRARGDKYIWSVVVLLAIISLLAVSSKLVLFFNPVSFFLSVLFA